MLSEQDQILIKHALQAQQHAYAPYSKFNVGAALRTKTGHVFTGCNVENCSYGLTVCAERIAIFSAVTQGYHKFESMVVVTPGDDLGSPCGACLQVMREFAPDLRIILANTIADYQIFQLCDFLPLPFTQLDEVKS